MWKGSVELLMPGRRCQILASDGLGQRVRQQKRPVSVTASASWNSRTISRQMRELQLLNQRLRHGDTPQLPEQVALRKGRLKSLRPSPRKWGRHHPLKHLEARRLPAPADAPCKGIEISFEFLVSRPKPRRRRPQPRDSPANQLSKIQRHLSVRSQFQMPLVYKQQDRVTAATPTVSLLRSETSSRAALRSSEALKIDQIRLEHQQFLEATIVPVRVLGPHPRTQDCLQTPHCPQDNALSPISRLSQASTREAESADAADELTSQSPTSEETRRVEAGHCSARIPEPAVAPSQVRLRETEWPTAATEDIRLLQPCQALCHGGQRPVISRAVLGAAEASEFATQHRPPMYALPEAARHLRPPRVSQRLSQPLELAEPRLPPTAEAAAVELPREVLALSSCSLRQFAGLPGSAAGRWASHRLLLWPAGATRTALAGRAAAGGLAVAPRLGWAPPAVASFSGIDGAIEFAVAARHLSFAASHFLRLTVRPVAEPAARHLQPLSAVRQRGDLAIASASAAETIRFGEVLFIDILREQLEPEKRPADVGAALPAGDVGGDVSGFDRSRTALNDASGDRRAFVSGSSGAAQQGNNSNVNDSDSHGTGASGNSGCWDYVYLKSEKEEMRLVELHDTQERCSTVSTVMGIVGFRAPIFLAVPTHLLPARAIPVICGNVIELGDWDVNCSEPMAHTAELIAPGYAFFEASVCSNYSDEEEVEFRFAIVVPPAGSDGPAKSELFAWEGGFVRCMSDYKKRDGFLVFGQPDLLLNPRDLIELPISPALVPKPIWPGWLTDLGQAMLLVRMRPPLLEPQWERLLVQPLGVELTAKDATGAMLTPNLRGPLLLDGNKFHLPPPPPPPPSQQSQQPSESPTPAPEGPDYSCSSDESDDGGGINWIRLAKAASAKVEFAQQVPLGSPVTCRLLLRFHDTDTNSCDRGTCVEAFAVLPLTVDLNAPEEQTAKCDLMLSTSSERIGQLTLDISVAHCFQNGPLEVARFVDRCGAVVPLQDPAPVLILPMPAEWLLPMGPDTWSAAAAAFAAAAPTSRYFELPVGVSQSGVMRLLRTDGDKGGGQAQDQDLCLAFPPDARLVVRAVLDESTPLNTGADALLSSLLPAAERCALLASHDLRLCLALSLKQTRLPLGFMAGTVAEAASALDTCRHFGVRAVAAPASQLFSDQPEGLALAEAAEVRGVALYAYGGDAGGGSSGGGIGQAAALHLEGVFGAGTVVPSSH